MTIYVALQKQVAGRGYRKREFQEFNLSPSQSLQKLELVAAIPTCYFLKEQLKCKMPI
jgi:hypothetical protein